MLRHGANMDAGLCPLWLCRRRRAPGPQSGLQGARPHSPRARGLRPGGHASSSREPPTPCPKHFHSFSPPGLRPSRARGTEARGRWGASSPLPGRCVLRSLLGPHPSRIRLPNPKLQKPPSPLSSHTSAALGPAQNKKISSKGQKAFVCLFVSSTYPLGQVPWSLEDQAGRRVGRCYWKKYLGGEGVCLVGDIWGDGGAFFVVVTFL